MIKQFVVLATLSVLGLAACEGRFAGQRETNIVEMSFPYQMRIATEFGGPHLGLLNANAKFRFSGGSLQFYDLTNPIKPSLVESMSIGLPTGCSDFWIHDGAVYILNRSNDSLWIFDIEGNKFVRRLDAQNNPIEVKLASNPQRLLGFSFDFDGTGGPEDVLAVVNQDEGTVQFLKLNDGTPTFIEPTLAQIANGDTQRASNEVISPLFRMIPRQTVSGKNDHIKLNDSERLGYGINGLLFLENVNGTGLDLIVTASVTSMGIFTFRLNDWTNATNFAWDLRKYRDGYVLADELVPGTRADGIYGLDADGAGNVYFSNWADDSVYRVSAADLVQDKVGEKNTRGYEINSRVGAIPGELDTNRYDTKFVRVGYLQVDTAAENLWVLGLATGRIYRFDLDDGGITTSASLGEFPQRFVLYNSADVANSKVDPTHIYISYSESNKIVVVDPMTLQLLQ